MLEMAPWVKCLLSKPDDLRPNPRHPSKSKHGLCISVAPSEGGQSQEYPQGVKRVSLGSVRDLFQKNTVRRS